VLTACGDGSSTDTGLPGTGTSNPGACTPCKNGGTCGWVQEVFLKPE